MNNIIKSSYIFFNIFIIFFLYSCGGGGSSGVEEAQNNLVSINLTGLKSPSYSYENQTINISSNISECRFRAALKDEVFHQLHHVNTEDNKKFTFRNPISLKSTENFQVNISTISNESCPEAEKTFNLQVDKYPVSYTHLTLPTKA